MDGAPRGSEYEPGLSERRIAGKALDYLGLQASAGAAVLVSRLAGGPTVGAGVLVGLAVWVCGCARYFTGGQTPGMWLVGVRALDEVGEQRTGTALIEPWFELDSGRPNWGC